jgi:hypothetical protein
MSGPFSKDQKEEDETNMQRTLKRKRTNQKTNNDNIKCTHCGLMGDTRINSSKCLHNKQFMEQEKKRAKKARVKGTYHMQHVCVSMYRSF